jgi:hypothetical protein
MKPNKDDNFRAMRNAWKGALQKTGSFSDYHYNVHTFYLNRTIRWKVGMVNFIKSTYIKLLRSPCNILLTVYCKMWHLVRNVEKVVHYNKIHKKLTCCKYIVVISMLYTIISL